MRDCDILSGNSSKHSSIFDGLSISVINEYKFLIRLFFSNEIFLFLFELNEFHTFMAPWMNCKCGKTRANTSGKACAQLLGDHEAMPINNCPFRVANGLPASPTHIPTLRWLNVQIVFEWTLTPFRPKSLTHSSRLYVIVCNHCNLDVDAVEPGCKFQLKIITTTLFKWN